MKITEVKAFALSFKLENAPRRGVGQPVKKDTVIVRVKTEDGIVGYGEAHHALAPTLVADLVNTNLAPIVVGCNAMEVEDIWQRIYLKQVFKFDNPNVDATCGCGESFSVKEKTQ